MIRRLADHLPLLYFGLAVIVPNIRYHANVASAHLQIKVVGYANRVYLECVVLVGLKVLCEGNDGGLELVVSI